MVKKLSGLLAALSILNSSGAIKQAAALFTALSELCALENKTSGAGASAQNTNGATAGASDFKK